MIETQEDEPGRVLFNRVTGSVAYIRPASQREGFCDVHFISVDAPIPEDTDFHKLRTCTKYCLSHNHRYHGGLYGLEDIQGRVFAVDWCQQIRARAS